MIKQWIAAVTAFSLGVSACVAMPSVPGNGAVVYAAEKSGAQQMSVEKTDDFIQVYTADAADVTYRELSDGTVSIVSYNGECQTDGSAATLTFPDTIEGKTVSRIESTALNQYESAHGCYVTAVVLPAGLKELDVRVFRELYYLAEIDVDASNTYFYSDNGILFNKDRTTLIRMPVAWPTDDDTKEYVIPDSVTAIGDDAFYNAYTVQNVTISKNVKSIGDCVFFRYLPLNYEFTFQIAEGNDSFVLDADGSLFTSDKKVLIRYVFPEDEEAFFNLVRYKIPDTVTTIASGAFQGSTGSGWVDGLVYVDIPDSVTSIGESAFESCTYLGDPTFMETAGVEENFTIPDSVQTIGSRAFVNCGFQNITIPSGITEIGAKTFSDCKYLNQVVIPDSVKTIGAGAFSDCSVLQEITLGKSVQQIGDMALFNCTSLLKIKVPDSVQTIGLRALGFYNDAGTITGVDGFTIECTAGSAGYLYAQENGFATVVTETPAPSPSAAPTVVPVPQPPVGPVTDPTKAPAVTETAGAGTETPAPSQTAAEETPGETASPSETPKESEVPSSAPTQMVTVTPSTEPSAQPGTDRSSASPSVTPKADETVSKPGKVSGLSVKAAKGRKITVRWKKSATVSGYEIQYGTKAGFSGAKKVTVKKASTHSRTIRGLKKKRYYVRIRAWRGDRGKKVYSAWSVAKKVKVTK